VGGDAVQLDLRFAGELEKDEFEELREVLRNAGAERVHRPLLADPTPGYRGGEGKIADMVATLEPTVGVVDQVLTALRNWLRVRPQRTIELTIGQDVIKINGLSSAEEDRLTDAFVHRVAERVRIMTEFIVRLEKDNSGQLGRYVYEFRSSDGRGLQEHTAETAPVLVRDLCRRIDATIKEALGSAPVNADPVGDLARLGHSLYNALFLPRTGELPDLARRLNHMTGPLLLRSNESDIPWELLHDGTDFLGLAHDMGRRKRQGGWDVGGRGIDRLNRALIVGDPNDNLPAAREEAVDLEAWLRRHNVDCTLLLGEDAKLLEVHQKLESGDYDLLHYCGHVAAPHGTRLIGLRLYDDKLLDSRVLQSLANGTPPVVFINGCESASRAADLCSSFMAMGSEVAVGSMYVVESEAARLFSRHFYTNLMSGVAAGAAVRAARRRLDRSSVAWTAFVLYGDPSTRVSSGDVPTRPTDVSGPPLAPAYRFDGAASELIARVARHAAPRGIVMSMDLLAALLSTEEVAGRLDRNRLVIVAELVQSMLDIGPPTPVPPDTEIEFSDTVETTLAQAEQIAHDSGRDEITVADLTAAFAAVGGGSSAQLLELLGITMEEIVGNGPKAESPNGKIVGSIGVEPESDAANDVSGLFDDSNGVLRTDMLDPAMVAAIQVAALVASAQRTVISSGLLLYGFGIANNEFFGGRMRAQGKAGIAALAQLSRSNDITASCFSPRTRRVLERAAARANTEQIRDAAVLREILRDEHSSAWRLLIRLGVDPHLLLRGVDESGTGGGSPG
jgi:hypothetical protein